MRIILALPGRRLVLAAAASLRGGRLIGGDHVLVRAHRLAFSGAGIQVEHAGGLGREPRVADEYPRLVLPGFDGVLAQSPSHGGYGYREAVVGDGLASQIGTAPP